MVPLSGCGARHEFGEMNESRPILQKGDQFKLPGDRELKRYVQPVVMAKDASGAIQIEKWIAEQVVDGGEEN